MQTQSQNQSDAADFFVCKVKNDNSKLILLAKNVFEDERLEKVFYESIRCAGLEDSQICLLDTDKIGRIDQQKAERLNKFFFNLLKSDFAKVKEVLCMGSAATHLVCANAAFNCQLYRLKNNIFRYNIKIYIGPDLRKIIANPSNKAILWEDLLFFKDDKI